MRVERITKRKRKQDNSVMMVVMGVGLLSWAFISTFFNTLVGFIIFIFFGGYAKIFLQRNELGENMKEVRAKKKLYKKEPQTFVFSKN